MSASQQEPDVPVPAEDELEPVSTMGSSDEEPDRMAGDDEIEAQAEPGAREIGTDEDADLTVARDSDDESDSDDASEPDDVSEPDDTGISPVPSAARDTWPKNQTLAALEALLFASPEGLTFRAIRKILPEDAVPGDDIREALATLQERYERDGSGIALAEVAGGWLFQTRDEYYTWVGLLAKSRTDDKITAAALETLAIVAYKQPVTRAEIDAIRGVGSGQLIRTLMDKKMVKVVGRVDLPGRPFQYGTTRYFLQHFGLKNLKDLPKQREL